MTEHYDDPVEVVAGNIRMSPDAMRALKKATGRSMGDLLADDDDEAAKFQVMGFAEPTGATPASATCPTRPSYGSAPASSRLPSCPNAWTLRTASPRKPRHLLPILATDP